MLDCKPVRKFTYFDAVTVLCMSLRNMDRLLEYRSGHAIALCPSAGPFAGRTPIVQSMILSTQSCRRQVRHSLAGMYWRHTAFINNLLTKRLACRKYSQIRLYGNLSNILERELMKTSPTAKRWHDTSTGEWQLSDTMDMTVSVEWHFKRLAVTGRGGVE